jgi:hypothetical protein
VSLKWKEKHSQLYLSKILERSLTAQSSDCCRIEKSAE